jgi:hypothetical protein
VVNISLAAVCSPNSRIPGESGAEIRFDWHSDRSGDVG